MSPYFCSRMGSMLQPSPRVESVQLSLFNLGVDVSALRRSVTETSVARRASATQIALQGDWRLFLSFCESIGRVPLPATPDTCQLYVVHALKGNKVSSCRRRLWAIATKHREMGYRSPVDEDVRALVTSAARKKKETVKQAAAITPELLGRVSRSLPKTPRGLRDRCMLLLGFGAAMRQEEIVGLELADVQLRAAGLLVSIRSSKVDQQGKGSTIAVFPGRRVSTDPVRAFKAWLKVRGKEAGPLFGRFDSYDRIYRPLRGMKPPAVMAIVRAAVRPVVGEVEAKKYSGHSLRAGAITAALHAQVPESVVMRELSRHKKHETLARYCRQAQVFTSNPLPKVL